MEKECWPDLGVMFQDLETGETLCFTCAVGRATKKGKRFDVYLQPRAVIKPCSKCGEVFAPNVVDVVDVKVEKTVYITDTSRSMRAESIRNWVSRTVRAHAEVYAHTGEITITTASDHQVDISIPAYMDIIGYLTDVVLRTGLFGQDHIAVSLKHAIDLLKLPECVGEIHKGAYRIVVVTDGKFGFINELKHTFDNLLCNEMVHITFVIPPFGGDFMVTKQEVHAIFYNKIPCSYEVIEM